MSSGNEAPKLYTTKPKKSAQLKKQKKAKGSSPQPPPPPPPPPKAAAAPPPAPLKESLARRYKFLWPLLLTVNLAVGGYVFLRTTKKDKSAEEGELARDAPSTSAAETTASALHRSIIAEDKQRELFQWMLEEKRKVLSKDPEEQKRIEEEKAILKELIVRKSIPRI